MLLDIEDEISAIVKRIEICRPQQPFNHMLFRQFIHELAEPPDSIGSSVKPVFLSQSNTCNNGLAPTLSGD